MSIKESPSPEYDRGFSNGWDACAAQPAQAAHEKAPEAFAAGAAGLTERSSVLRGRLILSQPLLTEDELFDLWHGNPDIPGESVFPEFRDTARTIEQAVRAKLGVSNSLESGGIKTVEIDGIKTVPMTDEQLKAIVLQRFLTGERMRRDTDWLFRSGGTPSNVWGRDLEWLVREVERHHGIVGKEGA